MPDFDTSEPLREAWLRAKLTTLTKAAKGVLASHDAQMNGGIFPGRGPVGVSRKAIVVLRAAVAAAESEVQS